MSNSRSVVLLAAVAMTAAFAHAQDLCPCPKTPPEPAWKASVGGGLSVTGGNTNANSYNLSFSVTHDPRLRNIFKAEGLYLRTDQDGQATADKTAASLRDEYKFGRAYLFGQLGYLRDPLKDLDYLLSPALGAGYRLLERKSLLLAADASLGAAVERLSDREAKTDLALSAAQRLDWQASPSVKLSQEASGLWKANDFADSYYHFEASLTAAVVKRLELKLAFVDDFKNKPASPGLKKNDTALIVALVFKT
jgi:putative salt-induced outer membrane protein